MKLRRLAALCLMAAMLLTGCSRPEATQRVSAARRSLRISGICYDFNALCLGEAVTAFCMPMYRSRSDTANLRQEQLAALDGTAGWHTEIVPAAVYEQTMAVCVPELMLHPGEDTAFEAWFFRSGDEYPAALPQTKPDGEWTLGFFDADAGVFIQADSGDTLPDGNLPWEAAGLAAMAEKLSSCAAMRQAGDVRLSAVVIPPEQRGECEGLMQDDSWHHSAVTHAETVRLLNAAQEEVWPCLYPAAGTVFDAWRFADDSGGRALGYAGVVPSAMEAQGVSLTRACTLVMYDRESGLLLWLELEA